MAIEKMYLKQYPKGKYRKEVIHLRDSLLFHDALNQYRQTDENGICECQQFKGLKEKKIAYQIEKIDPLYQECLLKRAIKSNSFAELDIYRVEFPQGQFIDSIATIEQQLWDQLRQQYASRNQSRSTSTKAKKFIKALLNFGQQKKQTKISVLFTPTLNLKDWEDYPQESRDLVDNLLKTSNELGDTHYPLPSTQPPPSIKRGLIDSGRSLQKKIIEALQNQLDSVFTPNPFELVAAENRLTSAPQAYIQIDYNIQTLAEKLLNDEYPSLYIRTEQPGYGLNANQDEHIRVSGGRFQGYLLATEIHWNIEFRIPDSDINFKLRNTTRPKSSFSGVSTANVAYRTMMASAFTNYALEIAKGIGW